MAKPGPQGAGFFVAYGMDASDHHRLQRLEKKQDVILRVLLALLAQGTDMALHEELLASAKALDASADKLVAVKLAGTDAMTDVLGQLDATRAKLDAAAAAETPTPSTAALNGATPAPVASAEVDHTSL